MGQFSQLNSTFTYAEILVSIRPFYDLFLFGQ